MSILKLKDGQGNWVGVPTIKGDSGNGISSAVLNGDYTLTLTFTDGTTYKTPSIRGEKGEKGEPATDMEIHICSASEYDAETRIPTIVNPNDKTFYLVPTEDGTSPDLFTEWVYVNNAWEMFGSAKIDLSGYLTDVKVNGTSIVQDGIANIPIASSGKRGIVQIQPNFGVNINSVGDLYINSATPEEYKNGSSMYKPTVPNNQHLSTFYGLAKAAGADEKDSTLAVGNYTDNAKDSIQNMLGITPLIASHETDPFESNHDVIGELFIINGKLYRTKTALTAGEYVNEGTNVEVVNVAGVLDEKVNDIQIDGTSIITGGVANIPYAAYNKVGVVQVNAGRGTAMSGSTISTFPVDSATVKAGTQAYQPITPAHQHESVFYGLAKVSGDSTQASSDNPVGAYTEEAKASIQTMLGLDDVVRDTDYATSSTAGVVKVDSDWGIGMYDPAWSGGGDYGNFLYISPASSDQIKSGSTNYKAIVPNIQHESVFYGLAKASGDVTQISSNNTIGIYTEDAKSAISDMLNGAIQVSGTDPTITAKSGIKYICGEVLSLNFTPSANGICDVMFTSGSTPTVLTLPNTVKMPEWFIVEANTTYEINIADGIYGAVTSWTL